MEEDTGSSRRLVLFGRDISQIPCFRNSFLYGASGGAIGGLAYFLFTSKTRQACHVAVSSFAIVTLGYWFYCRYEFSRKRVELERIKAYMEKRVLMEGTEMEKVNEVEVFSVSHENTAK